MAILRSGLDRRCLGDVVGTRNMTALAQEVGMSLVGLNKPLSGQGNPRLSTIMKASKALGLKLPIQKAPHAPRASSQQGKDIHREDRLTVVTHPATGVNKT